MPNPLFNILGGNRSAGNDRMSQFMSEFNRFKNSFSGDPRAEVQKLLDSGRMTQDQYNRLAEMAKQIASIMPR